MSDCGRVAGVHDEAIGVQYARVCTLYPYCVHGAVLDLGCMGECVRFTNALPPLRNKPLPPTSRAVARARAAASCASNTCAGVARRRKSSMFFKTTLYPSIGVRSNGTLRTATS